MTITQEGSTYTSATPFATTPAYCAKSSTMVLPAIDGLSDVIGYNEETQEFTFSQVTDSLALLDGELEKTFTVTINYAAGTVSGTEVATET